MAHTVHTTLTSFHKCMRRKWSEDLSGDHAGNPNHRPKHYTVQHRIISAVVFWG